MWRRSERRWLAPALAGVALALAAALAAGLATPLGAPAPPTAAPTVAAAVAAPEGERASDSVALNVLRQGAAMGDPHAALTLVSALLDRYERAGNSNDLYEATQWMDRGWAEGHYQLSGLATRMFERHCEADAIRWHWICELGE